jgi:hypothetical protein
MNTYLKTRFAGAIIACVIFAFAGNLSAQTNNHLLTLSFQKTEGKLFKLDAMNEKVFEFSISGVQNGTEIDAFKTNLAKQPSVRLVNVIPTVAADFQATVTLVPDAKVKDFKQALINLGYSTILIDGDTKSLSEPEK